MPRLTDTQLVILSAAAERADGAVLPLPKSLKARGGALTSTIRSLLKKGLVAEQPAARDAAAWREAEDGPRVMLVITDAGMQEIGVAAGHESKTQGTSIKKQSKARHQRITRKAADPNLKAEIVPAVRPGTKQALLIDLLKRKRGATIDDIVAATGWQPHSVRGAISGTLKKKLGLTVASEVANGRGRVYRIIGHG